MFSQNGEAHCCGCALYRVASREVVGFHCTALESVESRAMYCKGSREAAQLVEARPQLVVSTAALRHQLVGGGPGSYRVKIGNVYIW